MPTIQSIQIRSFLLLVFNSFLISITLRIQGIQIKQKNRIKN